jgi:hypothetical protein
VCSQPNLSIIPSPSPHLQYPKQNHLTTKHQNPQPSCQSLISA